MLLSFNIKNYIVGVLILFVAICDSKMQLTLSKYKMDVNSKYVANGSNSIVQEKTFVTVNFGFDIIRTLKNVSIDLKMYKFNKNDKLFFVNEHINLCASNFKKKMSMLSYFTQKLYSLVKDKTNIFTCIHTVDIF